MKLAKLAMLAATAAFAAMAFIGASSASAAHPVIQLCKEELQLLLCEAKNLVKHPLKGSVLALAEKGTFKALFTITCKEGMGDSTELEFFGAANKVELTLASLTFTGCEGGCTKVEVAPNQKGFVSMKTEGGADWFLEANPAKVKFSGCTLGVTCTFEGKLNVGLGMSAAGTSFDVGKENQSFKFVEGVKSFCGETGVWNEGISFIDWRLDDGIKQPDGRLGSIHKAYLTLLETLTQQLLNLEGK
jgi:hypothetical protein